MGDFWVFGYGSLIWNPGFSYIEVLPAKIYGLHRALCIHSWVHRGTKIRPGLVLGLARGGSCKGMAFKVASCDKPEVIDYLRERELVTDVYKEVWRRIHLEGNETVIALTYVADAQNAQYSEAMSVDEQVEIIARARGKSGPNDEYIIKTVQHLKQIAIRDRQLELIAEKISQNE